MPFLMKLQALWEKFYSQQILYQTCEKIPETLLDNVEHTELINVSISISGPIKKGFSQICKYKN
jgi:hypothetical protein